MLMMLSMRTNESNRHLLKQRRKKKKEEGKRDVDTCTHTRTKR